MMPKNPVVRLVILLVVVGSLIYDLAGPGEAQSSGVVALEYFLLACGILGLIATVITMAASRSER